jgi:CheY-like chemotaxis protein
MSRADPVRHSRSPTVLVVDDEPAVRLLVERVLIDAGYQVISAMSGPEALELLERGGAVDLLLADLRMPVMSGTQLALKVMQLRPEVRVLLMAAYPSEGPFDWRLITKPFPPEALEAEIRRALDGPSARAGSGEFPGDP